MYGLIGVGLAFLVLGVLISSKIDFGIALLSATGVLLLASDPSYTSLLWLRDILFEYDTINLAVVIILIGFIGYVYRDSGQVSRIIKELRIAVPDRRMVIASIPAIFGLLPMPGGALVSAPLIDEEGDELGLDGVHKAFLNWWFRHAWFSIYPLSVGLIFAASIAGVNIYHIALFNLPIFAVHLIAGAVFGLGKIKVEQQKDDGTVKFLLLIYDFLPIIMALILNGVFGIPMALCLLIAVIILMMQNRERYDSSNLPNLLKNGISVKLLMAAIGIMMFKGVIERTDALQPLVSLLQGHVPLVMVVLIAAFTFGFLLGHLPAAVGVGFPILIPLLPTINFQMAATLFLFTMLGYVVSPIHLCIVLTLEYFKADMKKFYRRATAAIIVLVSAIFLWLFVTGTLFMF